jgi:hypothetical protein
MTRVSTGELIARLTPAAPTPGSPDVIESLPNGQLVRAEVIRLISDNLLTLSFPGGTVQAKSEVPVSAGDKLLLEVNRDASGTASLRLVTREPSTPDSATVRQAEFTVSSSPAATNQGVPSASDVAVSKLAGLIKPGGAVEQLIRSRPELADRVEQLLQTTAQRPTNSLGESITSLQREVTRLIDQLPSAGDAKTELQQAVRRVADQLIADRSFADPPKLASNFLNQVVTLAKGLESTLAKVIQQPSVSIPAPNAAPPTLPTISSVESPARATLPQASVIAPDQVVNRSAIAATTGKSVEQILLSAIQESSSPTSTDSTALPIASTSKTNIVGTLAANQVEPQNSPVTPLTDSRASAGATTPSPERVTSSPIFTTADKENPLPTTVRGVLDSDLKGQLFELRGRLESLGVDSPSPALSASIARTDKLIEQLTSQQIRNVDGLNQYFSVSLPVDPRTGVSQAQLQAFYRKGSGGTDPTLDDSSRFTVALFLQLSQLGDVLATVTGVEGTVSIGLTAENSSAAEQLSRGLEELRSGLDEIGQAGAMITVRERPMSDETSPTTSILEGDLWGDFIEPTLHPPAAGSRLNSEA